MNDLVALERLTASINDACLMTGLGRNSVINAIERGELRSMKFYGRRLIVVESIRELIARRAAEPYEDTKRPANKLPGTKRGRPAKSAALECGGA